MYSRDLELSGRFADYFTKMPNCFIKMPVCFLKILKCFLKRSFDLLKRSFCFLILVFSASKISFYLFKLQFAFSFWCFPQVKSASAFSNPSLLSHFSVLRKSNQLLLIQTPVCFLISVFSTSKSQLRAKANRIRSYTKHIQSKSTFTAECYANID